MLPVLNIFCFRLFSGSLPLLPRLLVTCILTPLQIFRSTRCFRMQFLCKLCIFCFRLFSGSLPLLHRLLVTCILTPPPILSLNKVFQNAVPTQVVTIQLYFLLIVYIINYNNYYNSFLSRLTPCNIFFNSHTIGTACLFT